MGEKCITSISYKFEFLCVCVCVHTPAKYGATKVTHVKNFFLFF